MNTTGIYAIKNIVDGKCYIGQAFNIRLRMTRHFSQLRGGYHHCKYLQRAWCKYGESNFERLILEECGENELTEREQYWMDILKDSGIYNMAPLAGGSLRGMKRSAETTAKIISKTTGKKRTPEFCVRNSLIQKGKHFGKRPPFSDEWRTNISIGSRGKVLSPEHRAKIATSLIGNSHTLGHKLSEEHKTKISEGNKGKIIPDTVRKKLSEATKRVWERRKHEAFTADIYS